MTDDSATPVLTVSQRRIVGFALTLTAVLGSVALLIIAIVMLGRAVSYFSSLLWPLAVAGVLALILRPLVDRLTRRFRMRRLAAVILLFGIFVLTVAGLLVLALPPLIDQVIAFINYFPELWARGVSYVQANYPQWVAVVQRQLENPTIRSIVESFTQQAKSLLTLTLPSLRAAGGGVVGLMAFTAHVAIIPVYLFFFLLARGEPTKNLSRGLSFVRPNLREDIVFLVREFIGIVEAFFRGQIVIGLIMGVLFAAGFSLIGLRFGLFIGLALGVMNIIPYLGSIIGLAITIPLAFFQPGGGWHLVGLVLLVKLAVQVVEGWYLTPRIMGHQTGLHPVAIIVAVFFWGIAFHGVLGMLLAIPLTAFFVTAWRLVRHKYLEDRPVPHVSLTPPAS